MRRITMREDLTPIDKKMHREGVSPGRSFPRRSGVPVRTLEGWSARIRTSPNVYQLYKVAQVLECHIEDLIEPELAEKESAPEE